MAELTGIASKIYLLNGLLDIFAISAPVLLQVELPGPGIATGFSIPSDSFGARALAWAFILHGAVRFAAGVKGARSGGTLLRLTLLSYFLELVHAAHEVSSGTTTAVNAAPMLAGGTFGMLLTLAVLRQPGSHGKKA